MLLTIANFYNVNLNTLLQWNIGSTNHSEQSQFHWGSASYFMSECTCKIVVAIPFLNRFFWCLFTFACCIKMCVGFTRGHDNWPNIFSVAATFFDWAEHEIVMVVIVSAFFVSELPFCVSERLMTTIHKRLHSHRLYPQVVHAGFTRPRVFVYEFVHTIPTGYATRLHAHKRAFPF